MQLAVAAADDVPARLAGELGVPRSSVADAPVAGLYSVVHDHEIGYVTADGAYLIKGDMIDLRSGTNLTEATRRADRLQAVATIAPEQMIVFAPTAKATTPHTVTVFMDPDCGYCRKLHSELAQYQQRGIEIRYVAWPRTGPGSSSWKKAEAVWCASDKASALQDALQGKPVPARPLCKSPVAQEYALGVALGVHGTPTMILPTGDMLPGYLPADQLAQRLEQP